MHFELFRTSERRQMLPIFRSGVGKWLAYTWNAHNLKTTHFLPTANLSDVSYCLALCTGQYKTLINFSTSHTSSPHIPIFVNASSVLQSNDAFWRDSTRIHSCWIKIDDFLGKSKRIKIVDFFGLSQTILLTYFVSLWSNLKCHSY